MQVGVQGLIFSAVVVKILVEPDGQMCEKHNEYFSILESRRRVLDVVLVVSWRSGGVNP